MWKRWNGKELLHKVGIATSDSLKNIGDQVQAEANQQVPHDVGSLQDTGTVMKNPANKFEIKVGYGGGGMSGHTIVPYAVKHHEVPANFQKGRKHNYLRDPFNQIVPSRLKREIKKTLAKEL